MGANSVSNIGAFTASTHCGPRGTGPGSSQRASGPWAWPWRLDHFQALARPTRPAWSGLRSTYRRTTNRWSSSWIGKAARFNDGRFRVTTAAQLRARARFVFTGHWAL